MQATPSFAQVAMQSILRSLSELTAEADGAPGKTHHIQVGAGVLGSIAGWLQTTHPGLPDLVICDAHTKVAAADEVLTVLRQAGRTAELLVLDPQPGEDHVLCEDGIIERLCERLRAGPPVNAIAVGAGTINDIVKMATAQLGRPYQCVATAASMNGYTSAIAAVLSRGVKRTLPAQQAQAVFADTEILCRAPGYLNLAGFGDLLSKPYSNADWKLSAMIRGVPYHDRPARLLDKAFDALLGAASSIGEGHCQGIETLAGTIVLSGFTMSIAGTSAPASGGEHLVSHYWDMEQHCNDAKLFGLHGTQVGIATRMSAILFERLLEVDADAIEPTREADDSWLDNLRELHPRLTAPVVAEVRDQILAKQKRGEELRTELADIKDRWGDIRSTLREVLMPSQRISDALAAAGAPARPSEIGIDADHATRTLQVCRHIRSRYVGLDLIDDLGLLCDWAPQVVAMVEAPTG